MRIRDGAAAMPVTWASLEIRNMETGKITFRIAMVTDLFVISHNVEDIIACGRARRKCENEDDNVLKKLAATSSIRSAMGRKHWPACSW